MEFNGKKMTAFGMIEAEWSGEMNALAAQLQEHTDNTDNPHETSLEKIGAVDYVVARGTADDWHWEMWKSGKAVCYALSNFGDVAVNKSWQAGWYESEKLNKAFPSGLFIDIPTYLHINVVKANGAAFVAQYLADITKDNTGTFTLSRPSSMTVSGAHLGFYAVGRWKNSDGSESELETVLDNIIDLQEQYIGGETE